MLSLPGVSPLNQPWPSTPAHGRGAGAFLRAFHACLSNRRILPWPSTSRRGRFTGVGRSAAYRSSFGGHVMSPRVVLASLAPRARTARTARTAGEEARASQGHPCRRCWANADHEAKGQTPNPIRRCLRPHTALPLPLRAGNNRPPIHPILCPAVTPGLAWPGPSPPRRGPCSSKETTNVPRG